MKTEYDDEAAAKNDGEELLKRCPFLLFRCSMLGPKCEPH
jgi:hypothetical protein